MIVGIGEGDAAAQEQIEAGLMKVTTSYLKNGYLDYHFEIAAPHIDTRNLSVRYKVILKEGNQYRLESFNRENAAGLSLPFGKLNSQWKLKPGDVFDQVYFDEFVEKSFNPWRQSYAPNIPLVMQSLRDRAKSTVKVVVYVASKKPPLPPQRFP